MASYTALHVLPSPYVSPREIRDKKTEIAEAVVVGFVLSIADGTLDARTSYDYTGMLLPLIFDAGLWDIENPLSGRRWLLTRESWGWLGRDEKKVFVESFGDPIEEAMRVMGESIQGTALASRHSDWCIVWELD